jgi:hypothetical protein
MAAALRADGTGVIRVARTVGVAEAINAVLPMVSVEEVDLAGPSTSIAIRGAGWAEAAVLRAVLDSRAAAADGSVSATPVRVVSPEGAEAIVELDGSVADGFVRVGLRCGRILDEVVLRSYVIGAAHMALGWVLSEGLAVDADGVIGDLTIRSFGVLRASEMPPVEVTLHEEDSEPINGSDAVFAAVAAAVWMQQGYVSDWPTGGSLHSVLPVQP